MKILAVIPARFSSTRFAAKVLAKDTGKFLIQHTYEAARQATRPMGVCVATDSDEIVNEVRAFGGHGNWIRSVAYSPDGLLVVSGSDDNTLKLWYVGKGQAEPVKK